MKTARSRRVAAALFATVLGTVGIATLLVSDPAGATSPTTVPASVGTGKGKSVATLAILHPGASIRAKGETDFKPATEGAELKVGDTVQTDGTGFAEIDYTDDSFTRLDVNTTFTIISLTDDQGNRKIDGSLDNGRAWNRTSALTESESFDQEGAGATAAVVGSAFMFACDGAGHCVATSVVDGLKYTTVNGVVKLLKPLEQCTADEISASDTKLCTDPTPVTSLDALGAFGALNVYLDELLGYPGPIFGTVDNGVVTSVSLGTPPPETPPAPPVIPAPVIDPTNPICVDTGSGTPSPQCASPSATGTYQAQNGIATDDDTPVSFLLNGSMPDGSSNFYFLITQLTSVSGLGVLSVVEPLGASTPVTDTTHHYDPATVFTYTPLDGTPEFGTDSFKYQAFNATDSSKQSAEATVNIDVTLDCSDDPC